MQRPRHRGNGAPPLISAVPPGDHRYHAAVFFQIVGPIRNVKVIATSRQIRQLARLKKLYGPGRWRNIKGEASIRLASSELRRAELHWYEAQERHEAQAVPGLTT